MTYLDYLSAVNDLLDELNLGLPHKTIETHANEQTMKITHLIQTPQPVQSWTALIHQVRSIAQNLAELQKSGEKNEIANIQTTTE